MPPRTRQSGQFHVALAAIARNPVPTETLAKIVAGLSLVVGLYGEEHHDACGADEHRATLDAIHRRDVKQACALMKHQLL